MLVFLSFVEGQQGEICENFSTRVQALPICTGAIGRHATGSYLISVKFVRCGRMV